MLLGLKKLMANLKFYNKNNYTILNILFSFIPLSYIIGNFAINLNIFLLIVFSLIVHNNKIFKTKLLLIDKTILCFFVFALFSAIVNTIELSSADHDYSILLKLSLMFSKLSISLRSGIIMLNIYWLIKNID